ncbi:MFS transporter [Oleiharenicola lentus]|uniref:MFS transporter n=1 Tax=Oleiharenicola lentus TaxID=2508720 RepID=UPI003F66DDF0
MIAESTPLASPRTNVRYWILAILFVLTTVNYADRATLSIVGTDLSKQLGLDSVGMGYAFSAFAWAYVLGQIPGGWLLDHFGSRRVYGWSIGLWSFFTGLQGFVGGLDVRFAAMVLFGLRFLLGAAESPSFPANARIVATWFPTAERGTASAVFNSAQYFATVLFAPIMGWITHAFGWPYVFWFMGAIGLVFAAAWPRIMHSPREHPKANTAEVDYIARGGGLVDLDTRGKATNAAPARWSVLGELLRNRMLLGIYLGQYCINTLTWFFLTWFPIYLVKERGMSILKVGFVAALPALCGFLGGILGGWFSDRLLKRGYSLTVARKVPIVAGLLLSVCMVGCNYVTAEWAVIALMSLAFFGKGVGALGWAVISDTSPKTVTGLCGGLFNTFGNTAGIVTPIAIGYILNATGSFNLALVYVSAHAALAVGCYLGLVGEIKRVELRG